MRKYLLPATLGLSLLAAGPVVASEMDEDGDRAGVPRDQWLPLSDIADKLSALGYTVTEIETEDGAYEVEMVDKNGVHGEARVHPVTAEILPDDDDDDYDDDDD